MCTDQGLGLLEEHEVDKGRGGQNGSQVTDNVTMASSVVPCRLCIPSFFVFLLFNSAHLSAFLFPSCASFICCPGFSYLCCNTGLPHDQGNNLRLSLEDLWKKMDSKVVKQNKKQQQKNRQAEKWIKCEGKTC